LAACPVELRFTIKLVLNLLKVFLAPLLL